MLDAHCSSHSTALPHAEQRQLDIWAASTEFCSNFYSPDLTITKLNLLVNQWKRSGSSLSPRWFSRCLQELGWNDTVWQKHGQAERPSGSAPAANTEWASTTAPGTILQGDPQARASLFHTCFQTLEAEPCSRKSERLWVTKFLLHRTFLEDLVCLKHKWIHKGTSGFREQ